MFLGALRAPGKVRGDGLGGMFLWHFPSSRPDRTLSCTLPYEARTFLDALRRDRPAYSARVSVSHHAMCYSKVPTKTLVADPLIVLEPVFGEVDAAGPSMR